MKILMVLTPHGKLGDTFKKKGLNLEDFTRPYYLLKEAGASITLASPLGRQPLLDPESYNPDAQTESTKRFKSDLYAQFQLANTHKLAGIVRADFDAVFFPGGLGTIGFFPEARQQA